jgi:hypothetical protein
MSIRLCPKVLFTAGLLAATFYCSAWAQQKHAITISGEGMKGRYVQQHIIDVDDASGHQIRNFEIQRTFSADSQLTIDGEWIVEAWVRGYSNYTAGIGPVWGYTTWITDKGNKIFTEGIGTSEAQVTDSGSRRGTYHGTSRFTGGTGRFAKIRGLLVDISKFDTDPKTGYNTVDSHGEYWFEQ